MKTFFIIDVNVDGEHVQYKIKNTKLRKHSETKEYGIYKVICDLMPTNYQLQVYIHATYDTELCGTIAHHIKQRRYRLYGFSYMLYQYDRNGMLHHQPKSLADVTVTLEESGALPSNCTIKQNQR